MKNIALVAHDGRKKELIEWVTYNMNVLQNYNLYATGTTGKLIQEIKVPLPMDRDQWGYATQYDYPLMGKVTCLKSGPLGGDQQIGAMLANGELDLIIFLRDPLTAQPHEPDVSALLRLCDVQKIPLATNASSGKIMLEALKDGKFDVL